MKVVVNLSNNVVGGARKNAFAFILEAHNNDSNIDFYFLVPESFRRQLNEVLGSHSLPICYVPGKPVLFNKSARVILDFLDKIKPDLVYTMGGPSLVRIKYLQLLGISDPYVLGTSLPNFFRNRSIFSGFHALFVVYVKRLFIRYGDYFVFQNSSSLSRFREIFKSTEKRLFIVPNAISLNRYLETTADRSALNFISKKTVLIPSAYYPHKNLESVIHMINAYSPLLDGYKFIFTLPEERFTKLVLIVNHNVAGRVTIENYGAYSQDEVWELFEQASIVLVPSFLEVFSASYIEAVVAEKPLVVPSLDFVRDTIGNDGIYYTDGDLSSMLRAVLFASWSSGNMLVHGSTEGLTQTERFNLLIEVINTVVSMKASND